MSVCLSTLVYISIALIYNTGLVTNIFAIREGKLITAKDGILKGHIREMVINSAKALGINVNINKGLTLEEIGTLDEVFITGSGRMLVPVNRIEGTTVGLIAPVDVQAPGMLLLESLFSTGAAGERSINVVIHVLTEGWNVCLMIVL